VNAVRERGERVVATARRPEAIADLAGDDVLLVSLDVTREDAIGSALDAAVEHFGRIDVLVNNAGVGYVGALEEMDPAELRSVMETMFFAPAALTRAIVPRMRAQGSGAIVQISSQGGLGADAVDAIRAKHEELLAELERWESVARATAFDS